MDRTTLASAGTLLVCSCLPLAPMDDVRSTPEPVEVADRAETRVPTAAPVVTAVAEWRTLLPAPPREDIAWATTTADGRIAAMTAVGPKVLVGDRWVRAPDLRLERPVHDVFEVRDDCHVVRRRDGRDFGPPTPFPRAHNRPERCTDRLRATRVYEGSDGNPIALVGPRGHIYSWRRMRQRMGHIYPEEPDGPVGLVYRPIGSGWQGLSAQIGAALASVVPLDPMVLVSREGDVVVVEPGNDFDRGRPVVTMQRPRPLLVLELDGGALLVMRADGLRVIAPDGSVRHIVLDQATLAWLALTARRAEGTAQRVLAASLGGGRAILGAGTGLIYVDGSQGTRIDLGETGRTPDWVGEVWGLAASDEDAGWIMLTHVGRVIRGSGARWARVGDLSEHRGPPLTVSHPIGAFRGDDGRVRLLDFRHEMACASSAGLEVCGPPIDIRTRRVWAFPDALVIDDQSIDLHVVTAAGSREIPLPLPRLRHALHAGRADAIYALTDGSVQHLEADAWRPFAELPERAVHPRCFTVTRDDTLVIGLHDGEIIARPP